MTTPATPTTVEAAAALPAIKNPPAKPGFRLTRAPYVGEGNRLADITLNGTQMRGDVAAAVTQARFSYSAQQVTELALVILDSVDGELVNSGLLDFGTSLDFGDQHMEVRGLEYETGADGLRVTVKARSRLIANLRSDEHAGTGSWNDVDVSQWYADRCREGGAAETIIQPGLGTRSIARQESDQRDTTWDVMQRVATEIGVWCFEYEQCVVVGKPSWLAARTVGARRWEIEWKSYREYTAGLVGAVRYVASEEKNQDTLTFQLDSADSDKARPGQIVEWKGRMKQANGIWLIATVDPPIARTAAVGISCVRPVDPEVRTVA